MNNIIIKIIIVTHNIVLIQSYHIIIINNNNNNSHKYNKMHFDTYSDIFSSFRTELTCTFISARRPMFVWSACGSKQLASLSVYKVSSLAWRCNSWLEV